MWESENYRGEFHCPFGCSGARSAAASPSRASTSWRRPRWGAAAPRWPAAIPAAEAAEEVAAGARPPGCPSRSATARPARSTPSTLWRRASRTAPSGYVPYELVSRLFFLLLFLFFSICYCTYFLLLRLKMEQACIYLSSKDALAFFKGTIFLSGFDGSPWFCWSCEKVM